MVSSSLVYVAHGAPRLLLLKPCGLRDYSHTPSLARGHLRQPKATDCGPLLSCTELRRCVVQRVSKFSQRNQVPDDDRLLSLFGWGAVAEGEEQEVRQVCRSQFRHRWCQSIHGAGCKPIPISTIGTIAFELAILKRSRHQAQTPRPVAFLFRLELSVIVSSLVSVA